jgi:hypoxanthine-guanine phosphoribosyltransferase
LPYVLQVEDIIDSGHTLNRLGKLLSAAGAQSVSVVALLDKKGRRRVEFFPDYCGWEVRGF